jgi:hypothetical protein
MIVSTRNKTLDDFPIGMKVEYHEKRDGGSWKCWAFRLCKGTVVRHEEPSIVVIRRAGKKPPHGIGGTLLRYDLARYDYDDHPWGLDKAVRRR